MAEGEGSLTDEVRIEVASQESQMRWQPHIGAETLGLVEHIGLPRESVNVIRDEAIQIIGRCVSPHQRAGQATGLVVGYVQSGKTLSFTTVAALARDNGYPVVIVISGTSITLTNQSRSRLENDLRLNQRDDRVWRHLHQPSLNDQAHISIRNVLEEWRDPEVPVHGRPTILITVMKHHQRLEQLTVVLGRVNLGGIPVLIIDDEADQAGLNNLINEGEESTTYRRLVELKQTLPHHTFLQYTATPQGPLLINLIDVLSPEFARTVSAGDEYTGGREFFLNGEQLLRIIPPDDIRTRNNPVDETPESLLRALRFFFVGVATGMLHEEGRGNRTMMVHPSHRTASHGDYFRWVRATCDMWQTILSNPEDPDNQDLNSDFRVAYDDLTTTVEDLPQFDDIWRVLRLAIRRTERHLVNATGGQTPQVDWRASYSHILVGGQALDRGFTVEGLTVTYMPRGPGTRTADTIQQRARFFGYKRRYIGFCRVYLEQDVAIAYRRYVEHEEDIRARLIEFQDRPLNELRRAFLIPRGFRPTRDSIIDVGYVTTSLWEGWFSPRAPQHPAETVAENRRVIGEFLSTLDLIEDEGHPDRSPLQRHLHAPAVPLQVAYEHLLMNLRFGRLTDAQNFLGVLIVLRHHLSQNVDATCNIYLMSGGETRRRTLNEQHEIPNLFQGEAPVSPRKRRGEIYPGDRAIRGDNESPTIQIHTLRLEKPRGVVTLDDVPNVAVWIPGPMGANVLIQQQGGEDYTDD